MNGMCYTYIGTIRQIKQVEHRDSDTFNRQKSSYNVATSRVNRGTYEAI